MLEAEDRAESLVKEPGEDEAPDRALGEAREAFRQSYREALERQSRELFEAASRERFREAVVWQNRDACRNALDKLTRHPPWESPHNRQRRKWESLVASYLQRYCMKNDTIGFFGPGCWAHLRDQAELVRTDPGLGLIAERTTFFEGWGIDVLAEALMEQLGTAIKPWLRPRRDPFLLIQGSTVYGLNGLLAQVEGLALRILKAADGRSTARDLAGHFAPESATTGEDGGGPEGVYEILERLSGQGLLAWRLEVPLTLAPLDALRRELERIGDPLLRRTALEKVQELEAARMAVAGAAGDSRALDRALGELDGTFTRLTGKAALRARGKVLAVGPGRTLVFEDSRRDLAVSLGPEFLERLAPPLSVVLAGARWLSGAIATRLRDQFHRTAATLSAELGSPAVPLALFCQHALPKIPAAAQEIAADFRSRWQRLLPVDPSLRVVAFTSDEVRSRAEELFHAAGPGWRNARHQSPDILLAANDAESLRRGEFLFVLGELHSMANTFAAAVVVEQHPDPEALQRAIDLDLADPGVHVALPKSWRGGRNPGFPLQTFGTRSHVRLFPSQDHVLDLSACCQDVSWERSLPFGSAVIVKRGGAWVVPSMDGTRFFDLLDVLALPLRQVAWDIFKLTPPGRHAPRVVLDRLIVQRETWSFPVAGIPFLKLANQQDRFLAVRRWARDHGLPNFTFFKSPLEHKPVFLDLRSPISIDIFAKIVRRLGRQDRGRPSLTVTEMLPSPEQLWLQDATGQLYTSELRLVAVDRRLDRHSVVDAESGVFGRGVSKS
ncbi:MAG TPA: lantibiotic dehydratase [Thermoanaerobaculia bacterium]